MNQKVVLILVIIIAVMSAVAIFVAKDEPSANDPVALFPGIRIAELNHIELKSQGSIVTLALEDSQWRVLEKDGYPADTSELSDLVNELGKASLLEKKTSRPENFARLGVDDIEQADSEAVEVSDSEAVEVSDSEVTEVTDSEAIQVADSEVTQLVDSEAPQVADSEATQVPDSEAPQVADSEATQVPDSEAPQVPDSGATQVPDSEAPQVPDSEAPQVTDSEAPQVPDSGATQVTGSEATQVTLTVGDEHYTVLVGNTSSSRRGSYIRKPGDNQVWLIDKSLVIEKESRDWVEPVIIDVEAEDILDVKFLSEGNELTFLRGEDGEFSFLEMPVDRTLKYPSIINDPARALVKVRLEDVVLHDPERWQAYDRALFSLNNQTLITVQAVIEEGEEESDEEQNHWIHFSISPGESDTTEYGDLSVWDYKVTSYIFDDFVKTMEDVLAEESSEDEENSSTVQ